MRLRLVWLVPDPFVGARLPLGALLETGELVRAPLEGRTRPLGRLALELLTADQSFELLPEGGRDAEFALNREVLRGYLGVLDELRAAAGPSAGVDLTQFLTLPGVVEKLAREPLPEATFLTLASRALDEALTRLVALREQEGARLAEDVRTRLNEIEAAVERIVGLAPERERRERIGADARDELCQLFCNAHCWSASKRRIACTGRRCTGWFRASCIVQHKRVAVTRRSYSLRAIV